MSEPWRGRDRVHSEGEVMSVKVKEWLRRLGIDADHETRVEIDREIEALTGLPCDQGVERLSEAEFLAIVEGAKRRTKGAKLIAEIAA